ncbi:hypothetical protein ACIHEI_29245 [Kitasatospora sp. NPDC051984]|uniref:hypothetical protein n=1 Tax=Kitasatospora sp. NPDC051984 TaxID=3364059 RepID=UPI0037C91CDA
MTEHTEQLTTTVQIHDEGGNGAPHTQNEGRAAPWHGPRALTNSHQVARSWPNRARRPEASR